jgi:hypothetical protein
LMAMAKAATNASMAGVLVRRGILGVGRFEHVDPATMLLMFRFRTPELVGLTEAEVRSSEIKHIRAGTRRQQNAYNKALEEWTRWQCLAKPPCASAAKRKRSDAVSTSFCVGDGADASSSSDALEAASPSPSPSALEVVLASFSPDAEVVIPSSSPCALEVVLPSFSPDAEVVIPSSSPCALEVVPDSSSPDALVPPSSSPSALEVVPDSSSPSAFEVVPPSSSPDALVPPSSSPSALEVVIPSSSSDALEDAPPSSCALEVVVLPSSGSSEVMLSSSSSSSSPDALEDAPPSSCALEAAQPSSSACAHEVAPSSSSYSSSPGAIEVMPLSSSCALVGSCVGDLAFLVPKQAIKTVLDNLTQCFESDAKSIVAWCWRVHAIVSEDARCAGCAVEHRCVETLIAVLHSRILDDAHQLLPACEALNAVTGASNAAARICTDIGTTALINLVSNGAKHLNLRNRPSTPLTCSVCNVLRNCWVRNTTGMCKALAKCNGVCVLSEVLAPHNTGTYEAGAAAHGRDKALDTAAIRLLAIISQSPFGATACVQSSVPSRVVDNLCTTWIKEGVESGSTQLTRYACYVLRNVSKTADGIQACEDVFAVSTMCDILRAWAACTDTDAACQVESAVYAAVEAMTQTQQSAHFLQGSGGIECLCATMNKFLLRSESPVDLVLSIISSLLRNNFMSLEYYKPTATSLCDAAKRARHYKPTATSLCDAAKRAGLVCESQGASYTRCGVWTALQMLFARWSASAPVLKAHIDGSTLQQVVSLAANEFQAAFLAEDYSEAAYMRRKNAAAVLSETVPSMAPYTQALLEVSITGLVEAVRFLLRQRTDGNSFRAVASLAFVLRQKLKVKKNMNDFKNDLGIAALAHVLGVAVIVAEECGQPTNDLTEAATLKKLVTNTVGCLFTCCMMNDGSVESFRASQGVQALQHVRNWITEPFLSSWVLKIN